MTALAVRTDLHVNPGEIAFAGDRRRIQTLLGSCVSVTLWHASSGQGGMCHAVLPLRTGHSGLAAGCYADEALQALLRVASRRVPLARLQCKLFGGGRVLGDDSPDGASVGERNLACMRDALAASGLVPVATHCGGRGWRRLIFDLADGRVRVCHTVPGEGSTEWTG